MSILPKQHTFFTQVRIPDQQDKVEPRSNLMTIGSCFSDHIGNLLARYKFNCLPNPFGTIFNPLSICKSLDRALHKRWIEADEIHSVDHRYFHFDYHSVFNTNSNEGVLSNINDKILEVYSRLSSLDYMLFTFGTSIVYERKADKSIVANCHKVPSNQFERRMLCVDFMYDEASQRIAALKELNPSLKIILTVSPVRHTKEGLVQNSRSKSRLIELCHRIVDEHSGLMYFPSYEIMMDELRDYRFYKKDLIHPNEFAVDIIWEKFMQAHFSASAIQKVKDIGAIIAASNHKPFDEHSDGHIAFKKSQLNTIQNLKSLYPEVNFSEYETYFST